MSDQHLPDENVEKEFLSFVARLRSHHPSHGVSYQMNNYPEGIECTFRISRLPPGGVVGGSESSFLSNRLGDSIMKDGQDREEGAVGQENGTKSDKIDKFAGLTSSQRAVLEAKINQKKAKATAKRRRERERLKARKLEAASVSNGESIDGSKQHLGQDSCNTSSLQKSMTD
jgi:hypothetical protein